MKTIFDWYVNVNKDFADSPYSSNFLNLRDSLDRIHELIQTDGFHENNKYPPYNLIQEGNTYTLEFALAGFKKSEIEVSLDKNKLIVRSVLDKENTESVKTQPDSSYSTTPAEKNEIQNKMKPVHERKIWSTEIPSKIDLTVVNNFNKLSKVEKAELLNTHPHLYSGDSDINECDNLAKADRRVNDRKMLFLDKMFDSNNSNVKVIHNGISKKSFVRTFSISDSSIVEDVKFEDGLLTIKIVNSPPKTTTRVLDIR